MARNPIARKIMVSETIYKRYDMDEIVCATAINEVSYEILYLRTYEPGGFEHAV